MIGALIHIVFNTALVVVLAVIATIVFAIAWPFPVHPTPVRPRATPRDCA
jgi:hypothetical protein